MTTLSTIGQSPESPISSTSSNSSVHNSSAIDSSAIDTNPAPAPSDFLPRPKISTRKNSGTIIVSRDASKIELERGDEVFDEDDARAMSPRRNSEDLEKMSQEARAQLSQSVNHILHAQRLHESLLEIFNRIEAVKEEHDKLDSNNKFLQKYIGDLMSTSKITATGAGGTRKK